VDSTLLAGDGQARVFLQVSSSQNRAWSAELARQLEQQGLPARVLDPRQGEDGFRVVIGPYPTREAAESTGRRLGRPFFIYQPDR
jgi:cell division protein FtsN